jgi:acetoacetyl-CoA synthetase
MIEPGDKVRSASARSVSRRGWTRLPVTYATHSLWAVVWRHGDWLKIGADGGCIIYGRSDATINRAGLRMGTSEIYAAIEAVPEVLDSMVIDLEYLERDSHMALFVVLREGVTLDTALEARLAQAIRTTLSSRFVPDEILHAPDIPRTLSGKKQEVPVKKLFLGYAPEKVVNREVMSNPQCLDWYVAQAALHVARQRAAVSRPPEARST